MYPNSCKSDPKCPKVTTEVLQSGPTRRAFCTLVLLRASWASKICRENECVLYLDPFGSNTKRYDMHYMCHSTSICRFWGPFLHFPTIFFHCFDKSCCQNEFKLN